MVKLNINSKYLLLFSFVYISHLYLVIDITINEIFSYFSNITLKIEKSGNFKILGDYYKGPLPDEIYINEVKQNEIRHNYEFEETNNTIKLIWYNNINTTKCMFNGCSDINNFDFSQFDTSQIISMGTMFADCSSISSLNLSNFITTNVQGMFSMFSGCSSLISLDLQNFNTSQVTSMYSMFYHCSSLISFNLSNFDTSKVTYMHYMFSGCSSLKLLNLSNWVISSLTDYSNILSGCDSLIIVYLPYSPSITF